MSVAGHQCVEHDEENPSTLTRRDKSTIAEYQVTSVIPKIYLFSYVCVRYLLQMLHEHYYVKVFVVCKFSVWAFRYFTQGINTFTCINTCIYSKVVLTYLDEDLLIWVGDYKHHHVLYIKTPVILYICCIYFFYTIHDFRYLKTSIYLYIFMCI